MTNKVEKRIVHQKLQALDKQDKRGQSKHLAKQDARSNAAANGKKYRQVRGIYSHSTMANYKKQSSHFISWVASKGYDVKCLADCKQYIREYIQDQKDKGLSPNTVRTRAFALASVFGCDYQDFGITKLPKRIRANITRNRTPPTEEMLQDEKYAFWCKFVTATGVRRDSIHKLRKDDIKRVNGDTYVYVQGKGGKKDWCIVLPEYADFVWKVFQDSPGYPDYGELRVFHKTSLPDSRMLHMFRGCYAKKLYRLFESRGMANGVLYRCRKEKYGTTYDKGVLMQVSYNLLHSRCDVVVSHYLYSVPEESTAQGLLRELLEW